MSKIRNESPTRPVVEPVIDPPQLKPNKLKIPLLVPPSDQDSSNSGTVKSSPAGASAGPHMLWL